MSTSTMSTMSTTTSRSSTNTSRSHRNQQDASRACEEYLKSRPQGREHRSQSFRSQALTGMGNGEPRTPLR